MNATPLDAILDEIRFPANLGPEERRLTALWLVARAGLATTPNDEVLDPGDGAAWDRLADLAEVYARGVEDARYALATPEVR